MEKDNVYIKKAKDFFRKLFDNDASIVDAASANELARKYFPQKKEVFSDNKKGLFTTKFELKSGKIIYLDSHYPWSSFSPQIVNTKNKNTKSNKNTIMSRAYLLPLNLIIYGAPGTGKSRKIKDDLRDGIVYRTTFHPDTDYATFVGCFKPSMDNNIIVYKFQRQVFMDAYVKAWEEYLTYNNTISKVNSEEKDTSTQTTYKHVFLVIEEINRGNCAQIFGDIFQLLDRNKKGFSEYAINPDKDIEDELKKEVNSTSIQNAIKIECEINNNHNNNAYYLALPPNLHIWATMNTSDQSLFPMDSAFKRRWEWEYIKIDYTNKQIELDDVLDSNGNKRNYSEVLEKINARIKTILHSADKQMGVFFVKSKDDKTISFKDFRDKVIFYLFNDVFKNNKKFAEEFFCQDYPANFLFEDLLSRDDKDQKKIVNKWLSGKDYFGENNEQ